MSHEETVDEETVDDVSVTDKIEFAIHLMNGMPIAEVTEGYDYDDWEESMEIINMMMRRHKHRENMGELSPEFTKNIMFSITNELRRYDIGCLECAYREHLDKQGA